MKTDKFSQLTQQSLVVFEKGMLLLILIATVFAIGQDIWRIALTHHVAVGDLLLMFLYLEVMSMLSHYLGSGKLPVRYPLYIGMIALARFLVLDVKELDAFTILALSGSILLIALAILVVRFGHVRYPYSDGTDLTSN